MLILGSQSPRRKEILEMAQIPFKVVVSNANEDVIEDNPIEFVKKVAYKKASNIINLYPNDCVLCCDTIVYIDEEILGKPKNKDEAFKMINLIQGRTHLVCTGVYIGNKNEYDLFTVKTKVHVSSMKKEEIED